MEKKYIFSGIILLIFFSTGIISQTTDIKYLSGTGSDNTVLWDFEISGGRKAGIPGKLPVPSCWETKGYGIYKYYNDWLNERRAPDSLGWYSYEFDVPQNWSDKNVSIVFGGSMTDTEVKINGKSAGPVHRGGFYQFAYDISGLLNFSGKNLLEVTVQKFSSDLSVNRAEREADYWLFGGIFRPVWLEAKPVQNIERIAIDAKHTGDLSVDVYLKGITSADRITAQVVDQNGNSAGESFSSEIKPGQKIVNLKSQISNIIPWSAEYPVLYQLKIVLRKNDEPLHQIKEKFGFRTIEVRKHDGFYVNGSRVFLKGCNRHSFWPESGRTTNKSISIGDIKLMKEMNMNAVRCSHYPPDKHFLDAADSLGIYVIDELAGWQAKYDTPAGRKLVKEMVIRDVNHPSVIFWANGNEGGFNFELVNNYSEWDPQKRTVIHPWMNFNGINTSHYEAYDCCTDIFFHGGDLIMPTEFLHGLYDGGGGAGLDDWWNLMIKNSLSIGGFLWSFADEGIVRDDLNGKVDTEGNSAPDGIVSPYREKEGSFYAIREIWSPVYIEQSEQNNLPGNFNGELDVENRYDFRNLSEINFTWQLVDFQVPLAEHDCDCSSVPPFQVKEKGLAGSPDINPHNKGKLYIDLPAGWQKYDALYLTATDAGKKEIYTWSWMISKKFPLPDYLLRKHETGIFASETDSTYRISTYETEAVFYKNGLLKSVRNPHTNQAVSLKNGPVLISSKSRFVRSTLYKSGENYIVEAEYKGNLKKIKWTVFPVGGLKLDYEYSLPGDTSIKYLGVSFDYPEENVLGIKWLGKGPYRVWKNRLKGVEFNVWHKNYNDAITGERWDYPEFKGFHSNVYWVTFTTRETPITIIFEDNNTFLRVFSPREPEDPRFTHVEFPKGDISFLNGISPIGTKFHKPEELGPMGSPNVISRLGQTFKGTAYFYFGYAYSFKSKND